MTDQLARDLAQGLDADAVPDGGVVVGQFEGAPVLLARRGLAVYAVSASCTHHGGPLAQGLMLGENHSLPAPSRMLRPAHG